MTREDVLKEFSRPYQSHEDVGGPDADAMADEIIRLRARLAAAERQLEVERMRLAACGVAALGYFEGCADEYRSASLDDVLRLHARLAAQAEHWARKGGTLAAGEGLVLVQEIDRLRKALDEHDTARMTAELLLERERRTSDSHFGMSVMYEKEYERARDIIAALRNPSDLMVDALREQIYDRSCFDEALKAIRVAVAAAEREVSNDR